jgi:hypothetical protein
MANKKPPRRRVPWNTAEILFSVFGYLTTRQEPLILSAHHDAAPVAEILGKIADANGLPKAGNKYPKLNIPVELDRITNVPAMVMGNAGPNATAANPAQEITQILFRHNHGGQNAILRDVINNMAEQRKNTFANLKNEEKALAETLERFHKNAAELESIVSIKL